MNFDTTTYETDVLSQVDDNYYLSKAHSLRAETRSSHIRSFFAAIITGFSSGINHGQAIK